MKLGAPRRVSRIGSYLSVPLDRRINRRAAMKRTIAREFTDIVGVPEKEAFSRAEAIALLDMSPRNFDFLVKHKKLPFVRKKPEPQRWFPREGLVRLVKQRELNLGPSEAYLLFKRLAGPKANIAYGQFLAEAKKQGIIGKKRRGAHAKIYFADFARFSSRLAQILSWDTTKSLAEKIGMGEKPFLRNLLLEKELLAKCFYFSAPRGGKEIRIPPEVARAIIERQKGLSTAEARKYLKSKGVAIPHMTFFKWVKQGVIKSNPEPGIDNRIKISREALDDFIQNRDRIVRERQEARRAKIRRSWRKRKGEPEPLPAKKPALPPIKMEKPRAVFKYESEKEAFIERQKERGMTPARYDLFVSAYRDAFANWNRKEMPSPESIAAALWTRVGKKFPEYQAVYNFSVWLSLHKWPEIVLREESARPEAKK